MYRVEISKIRQQFGRAHSAVIESLGGADCVVGLFNHWIAMEEKWNYLHKVKVIYENGHWKYLDFPSQRHYLAFIIKWS